MLLLQINRFVCKNLQKITGNALKTWQCAIITISIRENGDQRKDLFVDHHVDIEDIDDMIEDIVDIE